MAAARPSFDQVLPKVQVAAELRRLGAHKSKSKAGEWVLYDLRGGGQALASSASDAGQLRLRVYVGECPCDKV